MGRWRRVAGAIRRVVIVGGEERQRSAEGGPRFAVSGTGQEHRGQGAARQGLAPVARWEQRRAGDGAEPLHVVGDVVARELSAGLGGHGNGTAEIKGQRWRVGEDAEHGAGAAAAVALATVAEERSSPTATSRLPDRNGMAMTTRAYPKVVVRDRRVRAPTPTRTAEQSTTIPRATAIGGMAAFSAGVRVMGAGSQRVSATKARPATAAMPT